VEELNAINVVLLLLLVVMIVVAVVVIIEGYGNSRWGMQ